MAPCATPRTGSPTRSRLRDQGVATRSLILCCRRVPTSQRSMSATGYKVGGPSALPLAMLVRHRVHDLRTRLQNSCAKALLHRHLTRQGLAKLATIRDQIPGARGGASVDGGTADKALGFHDTLVRASSAFTPHEDHPQGRRSGPDRLHLRHHRPAQGAALHAHRVLIGHLPGIEMPHEFLPQPGDRLWTPADWAWAGGLLNCLLPGLLYGRVPVVACGASKRFDPEEAVAVMARHGIRNTFIPPTALCRMMRSARDPRGRHDIPRLRTVTGSGGEALPAPRLTSRPGQRRCLGLVINEFISTGHDRMQSRGRLFARRSGVTRPGAIGKPIPGHVVGVIRPDGLAVRHARRDRADRRAEARPGRCSWSYWDNPDKATRAKFIGDWMSRRRSGQFADDDGYISFVGRDDDVITSSGYRIGPGEIRGVASSAIRRG